MAAEASARCLSVTAQTAAAPADGDPQLLERLVGNLVENAVRHNVDGGWLTVRTGSDPAAGAWLTVVNTGAVVHGRGGGGALPAVPARRHGTDRLARGRARAVDRPRGRGRARRRGVRRCRGPAAGSR